MTAEEQHLARLRELQRRYDACTEAGNESGCERIQTLIDNENQRWASVTLDPINEDKKGK